MKKKSLITRCQVEVLPFVIHFALCDTLARLCTGLCRGGRGGGGFRGGGRGGGGFRGGGGGIVGISGSSSGGTRGSNSTNDS